MKRSSDEIQKNGLTLIELMVVLVILAILILAAIFAYRTQLAKARDARRKADLDKLTKVLEDYASDHLCYPDNLTCGPATGTDLEGYLSEVPCDPLNNSYFNYFYTSDADATCKKWYKVYAKFENKEDPLIERTDCLSGCGPSSNYTYWVGSPNVSESAQLPGEYWPGIPGVSPPPGVTPGVTLTPTPSLTPTPEATPTPAGPYECFSNLACGAACASAPTSCGTCCPGTTKECLMFESQPKCCYTQKCPR